MKKILSLIILFWTLSCVALATELQGGVSFTVDSARDYIQEGQPGNVGAPEAYYQFQANKAEKVVYSYSNSGAIIGTTVQYKGESNKAYIYGKNNNLIYIDYYDKPTNLYPHRGYRYNMERKLILTSLTVSKNEMFRFAPDGKLIAHSINGIIYDNNRNIIGTGKE